MFARRRRMPPRLPVPVPESVAQQLAAATPPGNAAAAASAEPSAIQVEESGAAECTRCGFGAVRVGPLLGRLRLHLQTERFLAVHRGDAAWEAACATAGLALAKIAEGMTEAALDAPLAPRQTQPPQALSSAPECPQLRVEEPAPDLVWTREQHSRWDEGWGTRKTGTATLAGCGYDRGAR